MCNYDLIYRYGLSAKDYNRGFGIIRHISLFVCMYTCCDKNSGKVAKYFEIMAQLKLTLT